MDQQKDIRVLRLVTLPLTQEGRRKRREIDSYATGVIIKVYTGRGATGMGGAWDVHSTL